MNGQKKDVLVGTITLCLFVGLLLFAYWLSGSSNKATKPFDILFHQSVSGLSIGNSVQYSGVPVGHVEEIVLIPKDPGLVRVRILVKPEVHIPVGTKASLQSQGFTGVSFVLLEGGKSDGPELTTPGSFGAPTIPTKSGPLGELLSSAPALLRRLSTLTGRLSEVLKPENQQAISRILSNTAKLTSTTVRQSHEFRELLDKAHLALESARQTTETIKTLSANSNSVLNNDIAPLLQDLRLATSQARTSLDSLGTLTSHASGQTLPRVDALLDSVLDTSKRIDNFVTDLTQNPASALLRGQRSPVYVPENPPKN